MISTNLYKLSRPKKLYLVVKSKFMSEEKGRRTQGINGIDIFRNEAASEGESQKQRQRSNYFAKKWAWICILCI